jgi:hypothetical protein
LAQLNGERREPAAGPVLLVEVIGFEPTAPSLRTKCVAPISVVTKDSSHGCKLLQNVELVLMEAFSHGRHLGSRDDTQRHHATRFCGTAVERRDGGHPSLDSRRRTEVHRPRLDGRARPSRSRPTSRPTTDHRPQSAIVASLSMDPVWHPSRPSATGSRLPTARRTVSTTRPAPRSLRRHQRPDAGRTSCRGKAWRVRLCDPPDQRQCLLQTRSERCRGSTGDGQTAVHDSGSQGGVAVRRSSFRGAEERVGVKLQPGGPRNGCVSRRWG